MSLFILFLSITKRLNLTITNNASRTSLKNFNAIGERSFAGNQYNPQSVAVLLFNNEITGIHKLVASFIA